MIKHIVAGLLLLNLILLIYGDCDWKINYVPSHVNNETEYQILTDCLNDCALKKCQYLYFDHTQGCMSLDKFDYRLLWVDDVIYQVNSEKCTANIAGSKADLKKYRKN